MSSVCSVLSDFVLKSIIFSLKVVAVKAADVCKNMVERCGGLVDLARHIQLATALSVSYLSASEKCFILYQS